MYFSNNRKEQIKTKIKEHLAQEREIRKIVLFGSFVTSDNPNDIDLAIFQDSNEGYLPLALKYRKCIREISKILPVDVIPLKIGARGPFLHEIESGETIYEK